MTSERELELLAVIEKAPHAENCPAVWPKWTKPHGDCACWKSSVDTSALAEHDAETGRKALLEAVKFIRPGYRAQAFTGDTGIVARNRALHEAADRLSALAERGADRGN